MIAQGIDMKYLLTVGFALLLFPFHSTQAGQSGAHVHGLAELHVAIDQNNLAIEFISPLENLVGFERAPRNDKERQAVQKMKDQLGNMKTVLIPSPAAHCTQVESSIHSAVLDANADDHAHHAKDQHAELEASVMFQCATPAALKGIEVRLFEAFPRLQRVKAKVAAPNGQSAATLTRDRRTLAW